MNLTRVHNGVKVKLVWKKYFFSQLFSHALPTYDRKNNEPRAQLAHTGKQAIFIGFRNMIINKREQLIWQPCPKYGCGVFEFGSRNLYSHLRYCNKIEKNNHSNDNTGDAESSDKATDQHACTERGVLESIIGTELDYLEFIIENDEGWELQENSWSS